MKQSVCDICYYSSKRSNPTLVLAKFRNSVKSATLRFAIDSCEKHQNWLKDRQGTKIEDINKEFFKLQQQFYEGK